MDALLIVLGAAVALVSAVVTEVVRDRLGRAQRQRDRRDELQSRDLRDLQDEVVRLVRTAGAVHRELLRIYDEATIAQHIEGDAPATELLRENSRRFWDAEFRIDVLRERAEDERVRHETEALQRLARSLVTRPPGWFRQQGPDDDRDEFAEMTDLHVRLNRRVGLILRGDADASQASPAAPGTAEPAGQGTEAAPWWRRWLRALGGGA